jgi:hypothetical protein
MPLPDGRRAFLDGLIDYAGLFPPAALDLDEATARYAADRVGPDAWMLGRFILPAARLDELDLASGRFSAGGPVDLSVLGLPPAPEDAWSEALVRTLDVADDFRARFAGLVRIDRFEMPLPAPAARDPDALAASLVDTLQVRGLGTDTVVALEVPILTDPDTVAPAAEALARANNAAGRSAFTLKLRCGGVTADAFPDVETLARAITEARRAGVPLKATAGLHHPLRHLAQDLGAPMHGFVNVFGGAILAAHHSLGPDDLAELLDDGDPAHWRLDEALGWKGLAAEEAVIAHARSGAVLSFGSCSFDDPRADLRALGWL